MLEEATGLNISSRSSIKKTLVARERNEERHAAFLNALKPYLQQPERLVFLDESGFNTSMTREYARAPSDLLDQGSADDPAWSLRAVGRVARNHGLTYTLICAMSLAGPVAPLVIGGALNGV